MEIKLILTFILFMLVFLFATPCYWSASGCTTSVHQHEDHWTLFTSCIVGSVLFLFLLFNSQNVYAQETKDRLANRFEIISTNFSEALASSNYGVAESALYHSVLFQHSMIGANDERLQKAANRLFQTSNNDGIWHGKLFT